MALIDVERVEHGTADCARDAANHVPALAIARVNGELLCAEHLLAGLPKSLLKEPS